MNSHPNGVNAHGHGGLAGAIVSFFIDSKLTPLVAVASILLGIAAVVLLPREEEPQIVVPMIDVFVEMPAASAKEVQQRVTRPLEKLLWEIPGVEYIYSTSMPGRAMLVVRFEVGHPASDALVKLNAKIAANMDRIPPGVSPPLIKPKSIDDVPILALTFWSERYDHGVLRRVVAQVDDAVKTVDGVSETTITGGYPRRIRIIPDRTAMAARQLSLSDIAGAVEQASRPLPAGAVRQGDGEILIETGAFLTDAAAVGAVVLGVHNGRPVKVSDIARVVDGPDEPDQYVFFLPGSAWKGRAAGRMSAVPAGGNTAGVRTGDAAAETTETGSAERGIFPAVTLSVAKRQGTNAIDVAERVLRKVGDLKGTLIPADIEVTVTRHYGQTAKEKADELIFHMAIAVVSVTVLLAIVLGFRESMVVAVAIPVTLALTMAAFYFFGFTLNRITLFALIFSIGILVDDPIVDVENIVRHMRMPSNRGRSIFAVAVEAVNEVRSPLILATLAVMAAILPMAFVRGLMGPYMRPIPVGASSAMLFSMFVAFVITPWAAARILRGAVREAAGQNGGGGHRVPGGDGGNRGGGPGGSGTAGGPGCSGGCRSDGGSGSGNPGGGGTGDGHGSGAGPGGGGGSGSGGTAGGDAPGIHGPGGAAKEGHGAGAHGGGHDGEPEDFLTHLYRRAMDRIIHNASLRYAFLLGIALLLIGSVALVPLGKVRLKMLPFDNKSEFQIIVDMPEGTSLERTAAVASELAEEARSMPETSDVQIYAGTAAPYNFNGLVRHYYLRRGANVADIQVNLIPKHERKRQSHEVAKAARPALQRIAERHGARIKVAEVPPGPPVLQTLVAEIYGPDDDARNALARRVEKIFLETPGVVDVDTYIEDAQPKLVFEIDREKAMLHGVDTGRLSQELRAAISGMKAGILHDESEREDVDIIVRLDEAERSRVASIMTIPVRGAGGAMVPLGELVRIKETVQDRNIYHKNLMPVSYVTADVAGDEESPAYAVLKMREALAGLRPNAGGHEGLDIYLASQPFAGDRYALKWDGEMHITYEVFRDLGLAFAAVLILIYVLVVGWFESFVTPLIIMAAIPFSLVGILPAHWGLDIFFSATSMIGFIAGAGIVVRNSIILVDFIELRLREGMPLDKAVVDAGAVRFRPMMLTAAAVIVGAGVILFDPIFQGLALSLMAGEVASLLLSRMAVPVFYYMFGGRGRGDRIRRREFPDATVGSASGK